MLITVHDILHQKCSQMPIKTKYPEKRSYQPAGKEVIHKKEPFIHILCL